MAANAPVAEQIPARVTGRFEMVEQVLGLPFGDNFTQGCELADELVLSARRRHLDVVRLARTL